MSYLEIIERHIDNFPEMPALSRNLLVYLDDPDVDFGVIRDMVQYDPGLTANVLRLVNSVYFSTVQEVSSLQAALVRLGTKRILELVLSLTASSRLVATLPGYGLQANELLKHSIWTAVAARELARLLDMKEEETVFTVGLLHDLGIVILDPFVQELRLAFNALSNSRSESFEQFEKALLGMDHASAGSRILQNWKLSPEIVAVARWHHEPHRATEYKALVHLVHLADMLSLSQGIGTGIYGLTFNVFPESIKAVGLTKKHLEYTASKTLDKMRELETILS